SSNGVALVAFHEQVTTDTDGLRRERSTRKGRCRTSAAGRRISAVGVDNTEDIDADGATGRDVTRDASRGPNSCRVRGIRVRRAGYRKGDRDRNLSTRGIAAIRDRKGYSDRPGICAGVRIRITLDRS